MPLSALTASLWDAAGPPERSGNTRVFAANQSRQSLVARLRASTPGLPALPLAAKRRAVGHMPGETTVAEVLGVLWSLWAAAGGDSDDLEPPFDLAASVPSACFFLAHAFVFCRQHSRDIRGERL